LACLDSDILIDYLRDEAYAISFIKRIMADGEPLKTTVINACELYKGYDGASERARESVSRLLGILEILDLDMRAAELFRKNFAGLKKAGIAVGDFDLLIASIVMANQEKLATRNRKHFARIDGLELIAPDSG
jgi:predicted nucleic acid-binding protein